MPVCRFKFSPPPQPATVACKTEAQSKRVHVACTSSHVSTSTCMLSRCLITKFLSRNSGGSLLRVRCWLGVPPGWVGFGLGLKPIAQGRRSLAYRAKKRERERSSGADPDLSSLHSLTKMPPALRTNSKSLAPIFNYKKLVKNLRGGFGWEVGWGVAALFYHLLFLAAFVPPLLWFVFYLADVAALPSFLRPRKNSRTHSTRGGRGGGGGGGGGNQEK